jgi:hypothetical protein
MTLAPSHGAQDHDVGIANNLDYKLDPFEVILLANGYHILILNNDHLLLKGETKKSS